MAALDLSSKGSPPGGNAGGLMDDTPETVTKAPLYSASHGLTSNPRKRRGLSPEPSSSPGENDCSSSISSSDGHDTDGSTNTRVKPINIIPMFQQHQPTTEAASGIPTGPGNGGMIPGDAHMAQTPRDTSTPNSTTSSTNPSTTPTTPAGALQNRPFKMYPFDGNNMPVMYSQLAAAMSSGGMYNYPVAAAAAAAAAAATGGPNPVAAASMSHLNSMGLGNGMNGVFDSSLSLTSPIGQYLQQRKRRMEQRQPASSASSTVSSSNNSLESSLTAASPVHPNLTSSSMPSFSMNSPESSDSRRYRVSPDSHHDPPPPKKPALEDGERKDDSYWERRRKNNEAAKRSRDSRRAKEEEIALRAAFLEQENLKLRAQVNVLKTETAKLHYLLYNRM